nr:MAG TPA: hypothetical protein [Bacteriophage sp.]
MRSININLHYFTKIMRPSSRRVRRSPEGLGSGPVRIYGSIPSGLCHPRMSIL